MTALGWVPFLAILTYVTPLLTESPASPTTATSSTTISAGYADARTITGPAHKGTATGDSERLADVVAASPPATSRPGSPSP